MATKRVKTNGQPTAVPLQIVRPETLRYTSTMFNSALQQSDIRVNWRDTNPAARSAFKAAELVISENRRDSNPGFREGCSANTDVPRRAEHEKTITQLPAWTPPEKS